MELIVTLLARLPEFLGLSAKETIDAWWRAELAIDPCPSAVLHP